MGLTREQKRLRMIQEHVAAVKMAIEPLGAKYLPEDSNEELGIYHWDIHTKAGPLEISVSWHSSINTRFQDVEAAKTLLPHNREWFDRLNPHSGKWNFTGDIGQSSMIIREFVRELSRLLPAS